MDILFIAQYPPYPTAPSERALLYYLARELTRRHHIVDLLCFYEEPEELADVPRYAHYFRDVDLVPRPMVTISQLQTRHKREDLRFPKTADLSFAPDMWREIEAQTHKRHYDTVQVFGGFLMYEYGRLLRRYPHFITPLVLDSQQSSVAVFKHMEGWMYRQFNPIIVCTEVDKLENGRQIPLGVDIEYFVPTGYLPRIPTLLFVGDFTHQAHIDAAVMLTRTIFPSLKQTRPELELYIIGKNPPQTLKRNLADGVYMVGEVLDLRPYFDRASVYVHPVDQSVGISIPILQAMAMRTPVVTMPEACAGLDVYHGEHVLLAEVPEAMTNAILRLLQNPTLADKLQQSAYHLVSTYYNWDAIATQYEQLHEELLFQFR
jgi:glycosyltransferase involved in cell wall biosynthesis